MYSYDVNASINCKVLQLFQCFVARVVFQSAAMEVKQCATQKSFIYLCPVNGERARESGNKRQKYCIPSAETREALSAHWKSAMRAAK